MAKGPKSRDAARKARATSTRSKPTSTKAVTPKRPRATTAKAKAPKADEAVAARAKARRGPAEAKPSVPSKAKPTASGKAKLPVSAKARAAPAKPSKLASKAAKKAAKTKVARAAPRRPKRAAPKFLAEELGHPVDHEGEPIGAGSRAASDDVELQTYTLKLWRQMQSRRGTNLQLPAMERAGITIDQIWTAGVTDALTTSSTADEVHRYRQKLLFRANMLEAILAETVQELHRLANVESVPPRQANGPG